MLTANNKIIDCALILSYSDVIAELSTTAVGEHNSDR